MSTDLRVKAADYLRLRRGLGYRLGDHHWLIAQFLDRIAEHGSTVITVGDAEAPGSRAARRAVVSATRSALEVGEAAAQACAARETWPRAPRTGQTLP